MAEHKYVSLKDLLKDESIPKFELRETNVGFQGQLEFELISKNSRNHRFPSPSYSLLGSCHDETKTKMMKKKGSGAQIPCLKHSRSDDPLAYVERHEEEDDAFDGLEVLSQEMKNFSREERILKPTLEEVIKKIESSC